MKQHITIEQLKELSEKGKEKLNDWWTPKEFDIFVHFDNKRLYSVSAINAVEIHEIGKDVYELHMPLLSIGQMIEFLQEKTNTDMDTLNNKFIQSKVMAVNHFVVGKVYIAYKDNLCNALWEAVKEVLEK